MTINTTIERLLPCLRCSWPLFEPKQDCPDCGGDGEVWTELDVEVECIRHSACRGARDRFGAPLEPDEEAWCEIQEYVSSERGVIRLSDDELEHTEKAAWYWADDFED